MRFYLLFDSNASTIKAVTSCFQKIGGFQCVGTIQSPNFKRHTILQTPPELVIINLDSTNLDFYAIKKKLNKSLGLPPKYIGITASAKEGFNAFKCGFTEVLLNPTSTDILMALKNYKASQAVSKLYCISYYQEFQYLFLSDIAFLKAEDYTTDFFMRDGSRLTNFKTLKHSLVGLPKNFQRVHNSFAINSLYVRKIHLGKGEVQLRGFDTPIPVSRSFLENINEVKGILRDIESSPF